MIRKWFGIINIKINDDANTFDFKSIYQTFRITDQVERCDQTGR